MTEEEILASGFKPDGVYKHLNHQHDKCWGYSEKNDIGRKFFVQIRFWKMSKYSTEERVIPDAYDFVGHFRDFDGQEFTVSMSKDMCPKKIIEWCRTLHKKLECDYVASSRWYHSVV